MVSITDTSTFHAIYQTKYIYVQNQEMIQHYREKVTNQQPTPNQKLTHKFINVSIMVIWKCCTTTRQNEVYLFDRTAINFAVSEIMNSTGSSIIMTIDHTSGVVINQTLSVVGNRTTPNINTKQMLVRHYQEKQKSQQQQI